MNNGNELEILKKNLESIALLFFFSPLRLPTPLDNPTFSSTLCFQTSKQAPCVFSDSIHNLFYIFKKKKKKDAENATFSLSAETGLDFTDVGCSLVRAMVRISPDRSEFLHAIVPGNNTKFVYRLGTKAAEPLNTVLSF